MIIKLQKRPYKLTGVLIKEFKLTHIEMMEFEVTEASENSPFKVGESIVLSKNEIKYHITKFQ